jgi:uncharacterized protein (DUF1697 family)
MARAQRSAAHTEPAQDHNPGMALIVFLRGVNVGGTDRFVMGVYRRHMKTIGYLGQLDKLFGVPATTRNWNTIMAIVRIMKGEGRR